jgi:thioredoxin 1
MKVTVSPNVCGGKLIVIAGLALLLSVGCQAQRTNLVHQSTGTPRLVELGTSICIPCALMAPVIKELKTEYAGRLEVESIDTLTSPSAKTKYSAPFCATQVFIAASGKELFRHVGYYPKEDILAKWKELGVDLGAPAGPQ